MDPKTELNQFLQKHCKRPVTKGDIVYTTSKFGQSQFQTIVKLNCLDGQEYAGHLSPDQKGAEKSAAQQALAANADAVSSALTSPADPKKRKAPAAPLTVEERAAKKAKAEEGENPAITPKTQLNSLAMKISKRYLQKGETVYECNKVGAMYQATVTLACLPGEWKDRAWAGHPSATKQKAEQSAAEEAMKDLSTDPEMSAEAAKPKGYEKGFGKGFGKGMKGGFKGYPMMGNWGWQQQAWGGGHDQQQREKVSEEEFKGEVSEWKGSYGWVKASSKIDHPAAEMRGGKIYIHKNDLAGGVESVAQGQAVSFKLYADSSGLGAQEVALV
mmetsp:Transcript_69782/g.112526  ORF Transcript_69782/g.112526 Transcript_69782/m.112526 type:complete len:329 (+) Transcript_69782:81-1067(+)